MPANFTVSPELIINELPSITVETVAVLSMDMLVAKALENKKAPNSKLNVIITNFGRCIRIMDNSAVSPFMTFDTINETSDYTTIWWRIAKMKVNLVSSIVFYKDLLSLLFNIVGDTTPLRPVPNQE